MIQYKRRRYGHPGWCRSESLYWEVATLLLGTTPSGGIPQFLQAVAGVVISNGSPVSNHCPFIHENLPITPDAIEPT
jgi:hypothetical protein